MKMELPEIRPEERTPLVEALLGMIRELLDRVSQLEETNQQLRDEIAKLKGQKPKPDIKPSILESTQPKAVRTEGKRPGAAKRPKNAQRRDDKDARLHLDSPPASNS